MTKKQSRPAKAEHQEAADIRAPQTPYKREGTLVEFFARSPLRGSGLKIERIRGEVRKIDFD